MHANVVVEVLLLGVAASCAGSRDVVPETHDVRGAADAGPPAAPEGYVYVAKRRHGLVALAEARGIDELAARQAVDHLADELEACAARLEAEGKLADEGAGRVVAQIDANGTVQGLNVKASPGAAVAANFLVCVVSPLRLTVFPTGSGPAPRGIALESAWGRGAAPQPGAAPQADAASAEDAHP
jgi:hypothetical protein